MLIIPDLRVGYQNIPKVGTTSLFAWFHACITLVRDGNLRERKTKRLLFLQESPDSVAMSVANTPDAVAPYADYYRFALTRDPVRRFVSMYSNRVLFYNELSSKKCPLLLASGLEPTPEINVLVDHYEAYAAVQPSIKHHSKPMMEFLGPDLSVYNRLVDISEVDAIVEDMRRHFVAQDLAAVLKEAPALERLQTGGPKLGMDILNPYSFEKLLDVLREDYEQIPSVNIQQTKDAYRKARDTAFVAIRKAVAAAIAAPTKSGAARRNLGGHGAGGEAMGARAARNPKGERGKPAGKPGIEYLPCPLVLEARVDWPAAGSCTGLVLLKPKADADYSLQLVGPSGTSTLKWALDSPKLSIQYPNHPHAAIARFRGDGVAAGKYEIRLVRPAANEAWTIARFVVNSNVT